MTMMKDEEGVRAVVYTGTARDGQPFLHLSSYNGEAHITLSFTKAGKALLHLQNANGSGTTVTP